MLPPSIQRLQWIRNSLVILTAVLLQVEDRIVAVIDSLLQFDHLVVVSVIDSLSQIGDFLLQAPTRAYLSSDCDLFLVYVPLPFGLSQALTGRTLMLARASDLRGRLLLGSYVVP